MVIKETLSPGFKIGMCCDLLIMTCLSTDLSFHDLPAYTLIADTFYMLEDLLV